MNKIFDLDNPVMRFLTRIWDAMELTVLWLICSIPIVTIGASTVALFTVTLKMAKNEEGRIIHQFFEAFKSNLKQGIIAGLIMTVTGLVIGTNLYFFHNVESQFGHAIVITQLVLAYLWIMIDVYVFAIIAKFENTLANIFMISFVMAIKNFGWSLLMITVLVCALLLGIFYSAPLLIFVPGGVGQINGIILRHIFNEYIVENDSQ